jgi:hypothetical protein
MAEGESAIFPDSPSAISIPPTFAELSAIEPGINTFNRILARDGIPPDQADAAAGQSAETVSPRLYRKERVRSICDGFQQPGKGGLSKVV